MESGQRREGGGLGAYSGESECSIRSKVNGRSEATLAPSECLFDSASVKWFPGTPGGSVSIIPSLCTATGGPGCRGGICLCQIRSGRAGSRVRLALPVRLTTAEVELQVPPVSFRQALALDLAQQRLEVAQAAHRRPLPVRSGPHSPGPRQPPRLSRLPERREDSGRLRRALPARPQTLRPRPQVPHAHRGLRPRPGPLRRAQRRPQTLHPRRVRQPPQHHRPRLHLCQRRRAQRGASRRDCMIRADR